MAAMFNLTAFARELREAGRYGLICFLIERQAHRSSRLADLSHAAELVALMKRHGALLKRMPQQRRGDDPMTNIQGALFAQALLLYSRATVPGDKGRPQQIDAIKALSPEQQKTHRNLVALRDSAVAHFDTEARQDWHSDCLVLTQHDDGNWTYGSPYVRGTTRGDVSADITSLLEVIIPWVEKANKEALDHLHAELDKTLAGEPALNGILERHTFNPKEFFGADEAADAIGEMILTDAEGEYTMSVSVPRKGPT